MHRSAENKTATREKRNAESPVMPAPAHTNRNHEADLMLSLQRCVGNRAVLRRLNAQSVVGNMALQAMPAQRMQPKLVVGRSDDAFEKEADSVADRIMGMPEPLVSERDGEEEKGGPVVRRKLSIGASILTRRSNSGGWEAGAACGSSALHQESENVIASLRGQGTPLSSTVRDFMEPRFGVDLGDVRLHTDDVANRAAHAVGARAFTLGRDVVFADGEYTPAMQDGKKLIAHELAHVVQTTGGATTSLRRKKLPSSTLDATSRVREALSQADPIAGVGNPREAISILSSLPIEDLVATLVELDDSFQLDILIDAIGSNDQSPVGTATYAVRFTSPYSTPNDQFGVQAARGIALLPEAEQDQIISLVLERRGGGASVEQIREGMEALLASEDELDAEGYEEVEEPQDLQAPPPMLGAILPGAWNPGKMPVPFYIGNSSHVAIATEYAAVHLGDAAFYNFAPIGSILDAARALSAIGNPPAMKASLLNLKPDIANLTRRHVYEIKPSRLQSLGRVEALLYQSAFAVAGLPMALGSASEPGTSGTIPGPGGWFIFSVPEPGVITYRYRQPKRRRLRAPRRLPTADPSFMRRMQELTGLTGAALIVYIIISEGSRIVLPPRNLVPVP